MDSMNKRIVLWGTGQISEVVFYVLSHFSDFLVCGFCVDKEYLKNDLFMDKPVIPFEYIEDYFPKETCELLFVSGYNDINRFRERRFSEAKRKGYTFTKYISPNSSVQTENIGENVFIFDNCNVQPFAQIGDNVVIWSNSFIGHHSIIKDNCFIAPNVSVSGATTIGCNSFLGNNATIRDNVTVGAYNIIGAGVTVLHDTKDYDVYKSSESILLDKKSIEGINI